MMKWCPVCRQYTAPFVFRRMGPLPNVVVCSACGCLFNEEAMPDNPEHYEHKKGLYAESPKGPRRPAPPPEYGPAQHNQLLMDGLRQEFTKLREQLAVLSKANVTHYCDTCEKLARENEWLVKENGRLELSLAVAVEGLEEVKGVLR